MAFGSTAGPLVDAIHNQALLTYKVLPVSIGPVHTSILIPPLLAVAYLMLGSILPKLSKAIVGPRTLSGNVSADTRDAESTSRRGRTAGLAVASTVAIIKASELLLLSSVPSEISFAILLTACICQWLALDGAWSSLALALVAAIGGPLAELPLMALGCWSYDAPDYFPLQYLLGADYGPNGLPGSTWAGLNLITAPCYFAVTTDAIALGRWFRAVPVTLTEAELTANK